VSLRRQVKEAVEEGNLAMVEELMVGDRRAVRHVLGHTYRPDEDVRRHACRAIALAGRHYKKLVRGIIRRLVWAMNEESATNALTAPQVIEAIAEEDPELLLPMVPDLCRLAADDGLNEGLSAALTIVQERCPGRVGELMQKSLNKQLDEGGRDVK